MLIRVSSEPSTLQPRNVPEIWTSSLFQARFRLCLRGVGLSGCLLKYLITVSPPSKQRIECQNPVWILNIRLDMKLHNSWNNAASLRNLKTQSVSGFYRGSNPVLQRSSNGSLYIMGFHNRRHIPSCPRCTKAHGLHQEGQVHDLSLGSGKGPNYLKPMYLSCRPCEKP